MAGLKFLAGLKSNNKTGTLTTFNLSNINGKDYTGIEPPSFDEVVAHEMQHQFDNAIGNNFDNKPNNNQDDPSEIRGVYTENIQRATNGKQPRTYYGGKINKELLRNPPNYKRPK